MKKQKILTALIVTVVAQVFILVGMVALAAKPLWTGQEIRVATRPIDPRSLFRGNYARLNYDFSVLPESAFGENSGWRRGEPVYVTLQPGENGLYEYASASWQKPDNGVFLKGRLQNTYGSKRVKYGLEAWFAPKEDALRLEDELRDGAVAVLMIDGSGKAALKEIVTESAAE